jgi:hypothetical protein
VARRCVYEEGDYGQELETERRELWAESVSSWRACVGLFLFVYLFVFFLLYIYIISYT